MHTMPGLRKNKMDFLFYTDSPCRCELLASSVDFLIALVIQDYLLKTVVDDNWWKQYDEGGDCPLISQLPRPK